MEEKDLLFTNFGSGGGNEETLLGLNTGEATPEEIEEQLFKAVDMGLWTTEDLEFARDFGYFEHKTLEAAWGREPLTNDIQEGLKWRGWYDKDGYLLSGDEIVSSLNSLGDGESVASRLIVDEYDRKTYAKVFTAPTEAMQDYTDRSGIYSYANICAVEDGVTVTPYGEGHARIKAAWPQIWLEVPILDEYGKPTEDALFLAEDLETLSHFPLLNEDHFQEVVEPKLNRQR